LIEWITDNDETPHVLVQAGEGVGVPAGYVNDGRIVLNVSPLAIRNLSISNELLMFDGKFGGQSFPVSVPMHAVMAVYSKESGEGSLFEPEYSDRKHPDRPDELTATADQDAATKRGGSEGSSAGARTPKNRGHLRPVK
jgi:stringent starvation protein B